MLVGMPELAIAADLMAATLSLEVGECLAREAVATLLRAQGVIEGLVAEALDLVSRTPGPLSLVVARGKPMEPPRDAQVSYAFREPVRSLIPQREPGGRARFPDLDRLPTCAAGDELARWVPAGQGLAGRTVTGLVVPPPPPGDLRLRAGRGARSCDGGRRVVAEVAGTPRVVGSVVVVRDTCHLPDARVLSRRPFTFDGDAVIWGDVGDRASICVTGDVTIVGRVEGGEIVAGGTLRVADGAAGHARLVAGLGMGAGWLDGCLVCCGGDLTVAGDMRGCAAEIGGEAHVGGAVVDSVVHRRPRGAAT